MMWEIAATVAEGFLISRFFFGCLLCRYEEKRTEQYLCMSMLQIVYILASNYITSYEGLMIILHVIYSIVLCRIFFKNRWTELIVICLLNDVFLALINMSVTILFADYIKFAENGGFEKDWLRVILLVISKIAFFLVSTIVMHRHRQGGYRFNMWESFGLITVFLLSVVIVIFSYSSVLNQVGGDFINGFPWICVSLLFLNVILYAIFVKLGKMNRQKNEEQITNVYLQSQLEMNRNIQDVYQETMSVRHELNNLLTGLGLLLKEEKYLEAQTTIENILGNEIFNTQKVVFTQNKLLDTIINVRLAKCYDKSIRVKVEIYGDVNQYREEDMSIIFANLLDNAIKAASKSKEPYIELVTNDEGNYYSIVVKNTIEVKENSEVVLDNVITDDKEKIREKLYHGFGLKNVQKIVNYYNGSMINKKTETYYGTQILLPKKSQENN